jgi:cell division protein YceG involved in septum cleavage
LESNQATSNPTIEATTSKTADNPTNTPKVTIPSINYVTFVVPKRSNSGKIARLLQQAGLITDKDKFELEVAKMRAERHFMAGSFQIVKGTSEKEIITILTKRKD